MLIRTSTLRERLSPAVRQSISDTLVTVPDTPTTPLEQEVTKHPWPLLVVKMAIGS